jgi:hypothetical protein
MRKYITLTLGLLSGCGSPQQKLETASLADATTNCIRREAVKVAPKPVDLNTAAMAVIARCRAEVWAEEKALVDRYPGYREHIAERFKKVHAARFELAQQAVALARTN